MKKEIIGKMIEVIEARNEDLVGIAGTIVDETKNSIVIQANDERKTVLKAGCTFRIDDETIEGEELAARPEDRVKLK